MLYIFGIINFNNLSSLSLIILIIWILSVTIDPLKLPLNKNWQVLNYCKKNFKKGNRKRKQKQNMKPIKVRMWDFIILTDYSTFDKWQVFENCILLHQNDFISSLSHQSIPFVQIKKRRNQLIFQILSKNVWKMTLSLKKQKINDNGELKI